MKNILLLTPIYPALDLPPQNTPVVHYFTKEWIKMGYNVTVIHYIVSFPSIIRKLAKPFHNFLESKLSSIINLKQVKTIEYNLDGVNVKRIPLCKYIPHTKYKEKEISKAIFSTLEYCSKTNFEPDVIISHWINPQLEIMHQLKKHFNVPTCYIAHDTGRDLKTIFKDKANVFLNNIDIIGYRSKYIKLQFESYFHCQDKPSFLCYSGIPEKYIDTHTYNKRNYDKTSNIIFVGSLIARKHPSKIIPAVIYSYNKDFSITYIGEGNEKKTIQKLASKFKIEKQVNLLGRKKREDIIKQLENSDIFIMISKYETFGLVYLEAMAAGCITIASKKEGFDGIIKDGYNGFLCNAGDELELAQILKHINNLSTEKRSEISQNAIETAKLLTDYNVAGNYIKFIENTIQKII